MGQTKAAQRGCEEVNIDFDDQMPSNKLEPLGHPVAFSLPHHLTVLHTSQGLHTSQVHRSTTKSAIFLKYFFQNQTKDIFRQQQKKVHPPSSEPWTKYKRQDTKKSKSKMPSDSDMDLPGSSWSEKGKATREARGAQQIWMGYS